MFSVASQFREFEVAPRGHQFKTGDHRCEEYDLRLLFVCSRLVFFFILSSCVHTLTSRPRTLCSGSSPLQRSTNRIHFDVVMFDAASFIS